MSNQPTATPLLLMVLFLFLLPYYVKAVDLTARSDSSRETATARRREPLSVISSSSSSSSSSPSLRSPPRHDDQPALEDTGGAAATASATITLSHRRLRDDNGNKNRQHHNHNDTTTTTTTTNQKTHLSMTLCHDQCGRDDCRSYKTPLSKCYNGGRLFPRDDPSWTHQDYFDTVIDPKTLVRTVFQHSRNGSCTPSSSINDDDGDDDDDRFVIPLDECVGPFGPPRPWGRFVLVSHELSLKLNSIGLNK